MPLTLNKLLFKLKLINEIDFSVHSIWLMRLILGEDNGEYCMLCGTKFRTKDEIFRCQRPGCSGKYCSDCYIELNNTCSICMEPMEYGDFSDVSEEKGSSDEFENVKYIRINYDEDVERGREYLFEILNDE